MNNKTIYVTCLRNKTGKLSLIIAFLKYIRILYSFKPIIVHSWLGRAHRFSFFGNFFYKSKIIFGFRNTASQNDSILEKYNFYFWSKPFVNLYFCNSKDQINYLNNVYKIISGRLVYIANGYNLENENYNSKKCVSGKLRILMPSRICEIKNQLELLYFLLDNIFILDFYDFFLVGPVYDDKYYKKILALIDKNKILQNSIFINTTNRQIFSEFNKTNFVLLNSTSEGFSNVILETWSFQKVLIIASKCDPNNIIIDGENGYLFKSYEELKKVLVKISNLNENDLQNLLLNGKKSLSDYSFDKIANQYFEIYRKLLN
jgi:glycosyltransferase involved in cell wall biosynthesis